MATAAARAAGGRERLERERAFFLAMALAIAAAVIGGFSLSFVLGRSSLNSPWWVHLHGVTFMSWLLLYLAQNLLVYRGSVATHRTLGWAGLALATFMVPVGIGVTVLSIMADRTPFFFTPAFFLSLDPLTIFCFYGLTVAGIAMRRRTDWHRRLMLCGTIMVMAPGWGRILPMPLLGYWSIWAIWVVQMLYVAAGVIYDLRTRGRVHPAYYWGVGTMTVAVALMHPIADMPAVTAYANALAG